MRCQYLFLRTHLRIGIPPGAKLQTAADPAQPLGGDRSALFAAYDATGRLLDSVRFNGKTSLFDDCIRGRGFHDGCGRRRSFAFLSHNPTISS